MSEPFSGKLSSAKSRQLFYNADNHETARIFAGLEKAVAPKVEEVRVEEAPIDPHAALNERNAEMAAARNAAASVSDDRQVLLHGPTKVGVEERISLDDLTPLVRQAAEAAMLRRPGFKRR
jgi:hypothetical protein